MTNASGTTKQTIVALVADRPGVLNRIASMFRRRNFNIESLAVGHSEQPDLSRMTFVVNTAPGSAEQVTKQLRKLIDVVKVSDITDEPMVAREMALIKVKATPATRSEIIQFVEIFRADIVDVSPDSLVIEITGDEDKIDALVRLMRPFGLKEIMRTGRVAMPRGSASAVAEDQDEELRYRANGGKPDGEK